MASDPHNPDAGELFAQLLIKLQEGGTPDLDEFCSAGGQTREQLRMAWLDWRRGREALGGTVGGALDGTVDALEVEAYLSRELGSVTASDSAWTGVLEDLARHSPGPGRYRLRGEIARGGMGAILKIWDADLKRSLAKKVLLNHGSLHGATADKSLGRFLEEAQVTAQLEHPCIVPVHDLGVDPEDGVYFTMRLVRGRDLRIIFKQIQDGEDGWTLARGLGVLLKVCEAMAYAHSRNIVHRDLKPANVMVGRFGEVYVMDWGLARVLDSSTEDAPVQTPNDLTELTTLRSAIGATESDSPLFTQDGAIIGTPAFMAPEQARGDLASVGPRSDVYSIGAMLYQLLTSCMPYASPGGAPAGQTVLQRLLAGSPQPIAELASDTPAELIAICEKAMARDPEDRFDSVLELSEDLQAFLHNRVVRSYRTGAVSELVKWVQRNRGTALSLAALFLAMLGGVGSFAWQQQRMAVQITRFSDLRVGPLLLQEMHEIGPERGPSRAHMEAWLQTAEGLLLRMPAYRVEFELELQAGEQLGGPPQHELDAARLIEERRADLAEELALAREGVEEGEPMHPERIASALAVLPRAIELRARDLQTARAQSLPRAIFADPERQARHDRLRKLVQAAIELSEPERGAVAVMRARVAAAADLSLTLQDPRWEGALASIADREQCPAYRGLELRPQLGLVPLRRDPTSGLWEFLHVLSGAEPQYDGENQMRMEAETGIVLVLIPGGEFMIGAQGTDADRDYYDPRASSAEEFLTLVPLSTFFASKYEVTLGQWMRMAGRDPSFPPLGMRSNAPSRISLTHPVNRVAFPDCRSVLAYWSLDFPTEAQHEYLTRAGTTLPYGSTASFAEALPLMNSWEDIQSGGETRSPRDGHAFSAPVGSFPPNGFGLHETLGNLREWCLEHFADAGAEFEFAVGTGQLLSASHVGRTTRGGSYLTDDPAFSCRVSARIAEIPTGDMDIGLRPVRPLDR